MEILKTLNRTLETMIDAHRRLLDLAKEKRIILVDGNVQGLQNLVYRESQSAEEIQKLEQERMRLVQTYMERKGITGSSFTLEELINLQDEGPVKADFKLIATQLRKVVQEITHLNESNQQLLHTSLAYVQYSIGMHVQKEPAIGYGPHATNRYSNLLDAKV